MKTRAVYAVEENIVAVEELEIDEKKLGPDQILIQTRYSVVSAGTELACLAGRESTWFRIPQQLGYSALGEIIALGEDVSEFSTGDFVLAQYPHASHAVVEKDLVRAVVPQNVDHRLAVFAHMGIISITSLRASTVELGDTAVVLGQGVVGNLAAQLFRCQGCRVIGVDRIDARLEAAQRCGTDIVVNASTTDPVEEVKKLTGGIGAECVVEATGAAPVALQAMEMAAPNGEVILLGTPRGSHEADIVPLLRAVHKANPNVRLKGAHVGSLPPMPNPFVKHSVPRNARIVLDLIGQGMLNIEPLISEAYKPENAEKAYAAIREQPDRYLGIIFDWTD